MFNDENNTKNIHVIQNSPLLSLNLIYQFEEEMKDTDEFFGDDYNHNDSDYLAMQSFTIYKNVAKDFGYHFNATNIKKYSGSFSLSLYVKFGGEYYGFRDDEGEVMFFDVVYKCKKI